MSGQWKDSTRARRLPPNWKQIRARILERDGHRCTQCGSSARLTVDHVRPGDDHRDANLRVLCQTCHLRKSAAEGGRAQAIKHSTKRPPEPHPGLLRPDETMP